MAKLLTTTIRGGLTVRDIGDTGHGLITGNGYEIVNIRWSNIVETPTTISGYNISDAYTKTEIDSFFNSLTTGMDWKESVETFDDIATTYPNPQDGWTVNVKDTDTTYRFDGIDWIEISANAIPMASETLDGKMSKEDFVKLKNIQDGSEVNQMAYSNIKLGGTTSAATSKTDTFEFENGLNIDMAMIDKKITVNHSTITTVSASKSPSTNLNILDALSHTNGHLTGSTYKTLAVNPTSLSVSNTDGTITFSHLTTDGNKHIPAGGQENQWLKWTSEGTALWEALPQSSISGQGIVQLNDTFTSTSITQAATANMVKTLKDQLDSLSDGSGGTSAYVRKSGDQMFGNLTFSATADLGIYHDGGTKGMIRRGTTDNTTIVGNDSGATIIQSSVDPKIKVGAAAETDIFHMGRKPNIGASETIGILPIAQGGTGRGSYPAPDASGSDGFLRWNGTSIETFKLTLDNIGPGTGGEGGSGGEALDAIYLRRDGLLPMTGTLSGTSANFSGAMSVAAKITGGSIETIGTLKAGDSILGSVSSGDIVTTGSINATTTITATGAMQGSTLNSTSGEININGIKLIKNTTENSLDFVFE